MHQGLDLIRNTPQLGYPDWWLRHWSLQEKNELNRVYSLISRSGKKRPEKIIELDNINPICTRTFHEILPVIPVDIEEVHPHRATTRILYCWVFFLVRNHSEVHQCILLFFPVLCFWTQSGRFFLFKQQDQCHLFHPQTNCIVFEK